MMEASISIEPFGFDRVFRFGGGADPEPAAQNDELLQQIAALQDRIDAMRRDEQALAAEAREQGFAAGLAQARSERDEAILAANDALHAALDDIEQRLGQAHGQMMRDAADVALCAADLLAGHALDHDPARAIDEALGRVLHQVARGTALHIRVHPDSCSALETLVERRRAGERRALSITLSEDADVAPNDAHIVWAGGGLIVDAAARRTAVERELGSLLAAREQE